MTITNVLTHLTFADSVPNLKKRFGEAIFSKSKGNPGLVYESRLVNSFEPTGVPVSWLLQRFWSLLILRIGWS
jgi:hypothetical protein